MKLDVQKVKTGYYNDLDDQDFINKRITTPQAFRSFKKAGARDRHFFEKNIKDNPWITDKEKERMIEKHKAKQRKMARNRIGRDRITAKAKPKSPVARTQVDQAVGAAFKPAEHRLEQEAVVVPKTTAKLSQVSSHWVNTWKKFTKFQKAGIYIGAAVVLWNIARNTGAKALNRPQQAIPEEYERGYDTIKENLTDFGSPVNLLKTVQKIITPYYSTVRRATRTNTSVVLRSNPALVTSKHAIGHYKY